MSERRERLASLLQAVAATYIQHESNTDPLITITSVSVSPDGKRATFFFTTIPDNREADAQIFLKRHAGELRRTIKQKCNLKVIPHLEFQVDAGERHRQHMDDVVRKIERGDIS